MYKLLILLYMLTCSVEVMAENGILFLAHGSQYTEKSCDLSSPTNWEKAVISSIKEVKGQLPYSSQLAFGMWSSKCFDVAVEKLREKMQIEGKKLDHLIVFPIFISSYSAVIEMQKYIFKKRKTKVIPFSWVKRISFKGKITYLKAIDYNIYISEILKQRLVSLISLAYEKGYLNKDMQLILVMHGPVSDSDNEKWILMAQSYLKDMRPLLSQGQFYIISLRDDAPKKIKNEITNEFRKIVNMATQDGKTALVLPLLLSKGKIDKGIVERLQGLDYIWTGEVLLPNSNLKALIRNRF